MLEFLKTFRRKRIIKQLSQRPRDKKIINLEQVKNIALVFTVGSENDWNLLYHFAQLMERQGKQITMIGFQAENTVLSYIITHSHTIICREKDDFDFWGLPKGDIVDKFTEQHYDLLIDTTDQPNFFGQYMALLSDADLKVTYTDEVETTQQENIFDMMINGEGIIDLRSYLNHVVQYLGMIQK